MTMLHTVFGSFQQPADWLYRWLTGWAGDDDSDKKLTTEKALTYAPVFHSVNKIAGHVAQLPIYVYKYVERGVEIDKNHEVFRLLRRPNPYQTSIVFREMIAAHSLLEGNGRAAIVRRGSKIVELLPLLPDRTVTTMIEGVKVHASRPPVNDRVRLFFEQIEGDKSEEGIILFDDADILHIPGLTMNGVSGIGIREIASRNFGASINAEKRLASQMDKGFSGSLLLEAPNGVFRNQKDAEEFLNAFEERHHDKENAGKPGLLREGIKANLLSMNNKDAEMIENRRFQRQDAALYFGLESILGDDQSVSYNSLTEKNRAYKVNCLNRWFIRTEQEIESKLLPKRQFEANSHFVKFDPAELVMPDFVESIQALGQGVTNMILTSNEAREWLNMNPIDGGDVLRNPATTSGDTQQAPDSEPPQQPSQANLAVSSHIGHLIGVEANRVKKAASTAKNFVTWIDNFYSKKFETNFADNLESLGFDRDLATTHCAESKRQLLDVAGASTQETLAENVAACVSTWKSRALTIGEPKNV